MRKRKSLIIVFLFLEKLHFHKKKFENYYLKGKKKDKSTDFNSLPSFLIVKSKKKSSFYHMKVMLILIIFLKKCDMCENLNFGSDIGAHLPETLLVRIL